MKIASFVMALFVIVSVLPFANVAEAGCVLDDVGQKCIVYEPRIDVVFVIDSTGSMADEIRTVKTHLIKIIKEVEGGQPRPYLRVGVVTYRDHELEEKEYLYRKFDLTNDINAAVNFINGIEAYGGGDLPEAVADGLDVAINQMNWNDIVYTQNQQINPVPSTKRLIFLIGDAAPHGEGSTDRSYAQGSPDGHNYRDNIKDAVNKDIRIYTVSGSGIDSVGIRIFKEIASKTGGSYTHLSYIRREVQEYYEDEGFAPEEVQSYVAEARTYADYDKETNSILTNTLGKFAMGSMKAEAQDMGVKYDNADNSGNTDGDWIDTDDITGDVVTDVIDEEPSKDSLYGFFRKIFDKLAFWR